MEVKEITVLTYRDGPQVEIPPGLIQGDEGGQKWLRVRASHHIIAQLILGHMQDFKNCEDTKFDILSSNQNFDGQDQGCCHQCWRRS